MGVYNDFVCIIHKLKEKKGLFHRKYLENCDF